MRAIHWVTRHLVSLSPLLPVGFIAGGSVRIYHADRLGSVRWVTDTSQNISVSYVYEGFGKIIAQNGGGGGPYQFCGLWGYRNDQDAGLLHVGARYYEPEVGRWVQKDLLLGEIFDPQTLNQYGYCVNNPILLVDSTGCIPFKLVLAAIIIGLIVDEVMEYVTPPPTPPQTPPGAGYAPMLGMGLGKVIYEWISKVCPRLSVPSPWVPFLGWVLITISVTDLVEHFTGWDIGWPPP